MIYRNCGEMHGADHSMAMSPPCSEETKIIYAWAMDAPELKLPEGVSFHIGGDSEIQYVVLQIHYTDVTRFQPPRKFPCRYFCLITRLLLNLYNIS